MTICRQYESLPPEAAMIRQEVFVEEQGFVVEFDEIDDIAKHIVLFKDETPVGTCRFYWSKEKASHVLGRVAVRKAFRGQCFGQALLQEAEQQVRTLQGQSLCLAAQVRAKPFYEKQGYLAAGDEFLDEGCPHIWMYKSLCEDA